MAATQAGTAKSVKGTGIVPGREYFASDIGVLK